ncbi:MAG: (Fe-S)-binding protein [Symbiobacterium sp.]|uniref:(Fe-S)-binding protein n=1 Tax=Symbiobacterium sp. TaxID=1971213 RepID=UPI003464D2E6
MKVQISEDMVLNCMRCGFCLPACPSYRELQVESASPRGRIALMRAVTEGKLQIEDIAGPLDTCLGCRGCEPACPAGVTYGHILEQGRAQLAQVRPLPGIVRWAYHYLLGTPAGIRFSGWALWLYQKLHLNGLAHRFNLVEKVGGKGLADMERVIPPVASPARRAARQQVNPAVGQRRYKVGFFTGCLSDIVFFDTNQNAVEVLTRLGCEVVIPQGQGCCGAVHAHAGEHEMAVAQAKRNIAAFEQGGFDFIVSTAGGCGAALREYDKLLADDPEWADRARRFSARCRDFSELVEQLGPIPMGEMPGVYTYQDSCHLRNVQKVAAPPRNLLKALPGARFVELPEADRCCGAAGTFMITQAEISDRLLDDKARKVEKTGATTLVVANTPCHLEMLEGVRRAGLADKVQVRHIADVIAEAMRKAPATGGGR